MVSSVILLILGFGLPFGYFYFSKNPQFGGKLDKGELRRLEKSNHWKRGKFQNISKTTMDVNLKTLPGLLKENVKGRSSREPQVELKVHKFLSDRFQSDGEPKFVWYGHSVLLLQLSNRNLLIDPMFGPDASPIGPVRTRRFSKNSLKLIDDLPKIDMVLLTHDHYDHLDFKSIRKLKTKVNRFLVPLGVGRHLEHWGIKKEVITEFDWWQSLTEENINFTFTPSRHFSGRGPFDRAKSLWGGWVISDDKHNIYWSGDGGYDNHFKEVGDKLGPFDWGFMECGQYNYRWHQIHMYPEEAVQAAIDAKVNYAIPVHWGAFSLALHHWKDPIDRFVKESALKEQNIITPELGEIIGMHSFNSNPWWNSYQ